MKRISLLVILLILSSILLAQRNKEDNPLRFEINIGTNSTEKSPCFAVNCEEYGVAVCYIISTASSGDSLVFILKLLDVNMEFVKETSIVLPSDFYIRTHTKHNTDIYIALSTSATKKNATDIMMVKFNLESGEREVLITSFDAPVSINEIVAVNNIAYISLIDKKDKHHLLSMNFSSQQSSFVFTSNDIMTYNILSLTKFPDENNAYLCLTQKTEQIYSLNLFEFRSGVSRLLFDKSIGDSIYLTYAAPIKDFKSKITTIVGAYYSGNIKNVRSSSGFGYPSSGIYSLELQSSSLNLFPYRKAEKDIYYTWHQPLRYVDIDSTKTSYVFVAEAYSPRYKMIPQTDYDYYGRPYTRYYQEFIGYSTVMAGNYVFDEKGKLIWISNTDIENTINYSIPRQKVLADVIDDEIMNVYLGIDNIVYTFSDKENRNEPLEKFYPAKKYAKDIVEDEYDSKIERWYNNNYLVYGYQTIKNNSISRNNRRTVFYIQKLSL